ncbi:hypothetical protein C0J52_13552 [Blattella germanica]|nr:hypothetical protein C0J52_13552 [Blattella germanica]
MADSVVTCIEGALKVIENNAGTIGYLKRDNQERIMQVVSDIRKCLTSMKYAVVDNTGIEKPQNEVNDRQTDTKQGEEDSSLEGQVVPSIETTPEVERDVQHALTPCRRTSETGQSRRGSC